MEGVGTPAKSQACAVFIPFSVGMWDTVQTFSEGLDGKWGLETSGAEMETVLLGCSCL